MPRLKDAASMAALDSPMPGGMPPMDPAMMGGMPPEGAPPGGGGDIESALATIESSLAGAPPDKAEEIRSHINAIRDISASMAGAEQPPPTEEETPNPDEMPPVSEGGP